MLEGSGARTETGATKQKAGLSTGFSFQSWNWILSGASSARQRVAIASTSASSVSPSAWSLSLGAAARALGELAFDFLDRFGLRRMLHDAISRDRRSSAASYSWRSL